MMKNELSNIIKENTLKIIKEFKTPHKGTCAYNVIFKILNSGKIVVKYIIDMIEKFTLRK